MTLISNKDDMQPIKVLYIEYQEQTALYIKAICEKNGIICDIAQDCYTGIDKSINSNYNFIIIHVNMLMKHGIEIANEIRQNGVKSRIIFTSADSFQVFKDPMINRSNFIQKPITSNNLLSILRVEN